MNSVIETDLRSSFQNMAQRYDWRMAPDEDVFISEALGQYEQLYATQNNAKRIELAIKRAYSLRLYHGLVRREERAAVEIWNASFRLARRRGCDEPTANDLAQETVVTILDGLHTTLRLPETLLSWQFWVYREIARRIQRDASRKTSLTRDDDNEIPMPDPVDMAEQTENRIIYNRVIALLDQYLNEPERTVVLRTVLLGEKPAAIAQALGMRVEHVRLKKHRALKELRKIEEVRVLLQSLLDDADSSEEGMEDHGTEQAG